MFFVVWVEQIVGWRLSRTESGLKLQCDWNLKDEPSVSELYSRIRAVADAENYLPEMQTLENNKVRVEVWTSSVGKKTSENHHLITNFS
jgi:pterin-4a-carbinolamine dehydratase